MCGLALGDPALTVEATAMINVLGDAWADGEPDWAAVLGHPSAPKLHLYGKAQRPARPQDGPHHGGRSHPAGRVRAGQDGVAAGGPPGPGGGRPDRADH